MPRTLAPTKPDGEKSKGQGRLVTLVFATLLRTNNPALTSIRTDLEMECMPKSEGVGIHLQWMRGEPNQ